MPKTSCVNQQFLEMHAQFLEMHAQFLEMHAQAHVHGNLRPLTQSTCLNVKISVKNCRLHI